MQNDQLEIVHYDVSKDDYRNANEYDERRYTGAANEYKRRVTANAYSKLIGSVRGKTVLDVGCGTGRGISDVAGNAALAVGADASRDMISIAARKLNGRPRVAFAQCCAQQLPFSDRSFDRVMSLNFLHLFSVESQRCMVREMKRVTKTGGSIVLEFDNALSGLIIGPYNRWSGRVRGSTPAEIRTVIENDCRVVHIYGAIFPIVWRTFHRWPRIFVPVEKLAYYFPLNRLAFRIFYELQKL